MSAILVQSFSIFIMLLETLLLVYILFNMFHVGFLKKPLSFMLNPILMPIQALMKHSVFHSPISDITPIVAFIVLSYVEQLLIY